jgi:hypothetical protein
MRLFVAIIVSFVFLGASCPQDQTGVCTPTEGRCADNRAEVCDAQGRWQLVTDCADVGGDRPFVCEHHDTGEYACVPGGE